MAIAEKKRKYKSFYNRTELANPPKDELLGTQKMLNYRGEFITGVFTKRVHRGLYLVSYTNTGKDYIVTKGMNVIGVANPLLYGNRG